MSDLADEKLVSENVSKETLFSCGNGASEENFSVYSDPLSPRAPSANNNNNNDHGNDTERSSVASNSSVYGNDPGPSPSIASGLFSSTEDVASPLPVSDPPLDLTFKEVKNEDITGNPESNLRERRPLSGKFQWLWMFSKNGPEGSSEKNGYTSTVTEFDQKIAVPSSSTTDKTSKPEADQNNLKYIAQSMLENIEVLLMFIKCLQVKIVSSRWTGWVPGQFFCYGLGWLVNTF